MNGFSSKDSSVEILEKLSDFDFSKSISKRLDFFVELFRKQICVKSSDSVSTTYLVKVRDDFVKKSDTFDSVRDFLGGGDGVRTEEKRYKVRRN